MRRKDIREGDWVYIQRAGDVIPDVVGPILSKRTGNEKSSPCWTRSTTRKKAVRPAPFAVVRWSGPEGEVMYYCSNAACPAAGAGTHRIFCFPRRHGYPRHRGKVYRITTQRRHGKRRRRPLQPER